MPKPTPPMTEPARYSALASIAADDDQHRAGGERDGAGARADPRCRAAEHELTGGRAGEHDDPDPADDRVVRVEESDASPGPSEKNRPPIDQEARTASEASRKGRRDSPARSGARRQPEPAALLDRLRHE